MVTVVCVVLAVVVVLAAAAIVVDAVVVVVVMTAIAVAASGNAVVAEVSETNPYPAILLGEMLATSDLPGGVVNLLTGFRKELVPTFASHTHLRGISAAVMGEDRKTLRLGAADSVKRVHFVDANTDWFSDEAQDLYAIRDFVEFKTTWHPIGA